MNTRIKDRTAGMITNFHVGHWAITKLQWMVTLTILLQVFELPGWVYAVILPFMIVFVLILGKTLRAIGVYDLFISKNFKGIRNDKI